VGCSISVNTKKTFTESGVFSKRLFMFSSRHSRLIPPSAHQGRYFQLKCGAKGARTFLSASRHRHTIRMPALYCRQSNLHARRGEHHCMFCPPVLSGRALKQPDYASGKAAPTAAFASLKTSPPVATRR
jgi:hypothetical protein